MKRVSGLVLKLGGGILLISLVSGCVTPGKGSDQTRIGHAAQAVDKPSGVPADESLKDELSLPRLMLQRQQLCLIPPTERLQLLDDYRSVFVEKTTSIDSLPAVLSENRHKLNALMLASCDPARTPGVLSEMLAVVTEGRWPVEYVAFFDLLVASHRAYALLDERLRNLRANQEILQKNYETLRAEYEALQREHEETIKGISDIERGIDAPRDDLGL